MGLFHYWLHPHMLVSREREKLINAVLFFAHNTRYLGKVKLFKLLYLLDFEHFRMTGRSVTGGEYRAWKMGPVPIEIEQQWGVFDDDIASAIQVIPTKVIDFVRENVLPRKAFDPAHFTKRELRLLEALSAQYADTLSDKMIDVTHAENGAWATVWQNGQGMDKTIAYELAVADDDPNREAVLAAAADHRAIVAAQRH